MGTGYGANYADVISEDDICKVADCEEKLLRLKAILSGYEFDLSDYAQSVVNSDTISNLDKEATDEENDIVNKAYEDLQNCFLKNTGLSLNLEYHDMVDGDRYDDVDGYFWRLSDVY